MNVFAGFTAVEDPEEVASALARYAAEAELKRNSLRFPAIRSKVPAGVVVVKARRETDDSASGPSAGV
jgi:hypothetical protein